MAVMPETWTEMRSDDFRREVGRRFDQVDRQLTDVNHRLDQVDQRFDQVDQCFQDVDQRFDATDRRFDATDQRLDRIETEVHALRSEVIGEFRAIRAEMGAMHRSFVQFAYAALATIFLGACGFITTLITIQG